MTNKETATIKVAKLLVQVTSIQLGILLWNTTQQVAMDLNAQKHFWEPYLGV